MEGYQSHLYPGSAMDAAHSGARASGTLVLWCEKNIIKIDKPTKLISTPFGVYFPKNTPFNQGKGVPKSSSQPGPKITQRRPWEVLNKSRNVTVFDHQSTVQRSVHILLAYNKGSFQHSDSTTLYQNMTCGNKVITQLPRRVYEAAV